MAEKSLECIDNQETAIDPEQSDFEMFNLLSSAPSAPNLSSDLTQLNWETLDTGSL